MMRFHIHAIIASLAVLLVSCAQAPKDIQTKSFFQKDSTEYSRMSMKIDLPVSSGSVASNIKAKLMKVTDDILSRVTSYENERFYPPYDGDKADADAFVDYYFKQTSSLIEHLSRSEVEERNAYIMEDDDMSEAQKKQILAYIPMWGYDFSLEKIYENPACVVFKSMDYIYMGGAHGGVVGKGGLTFDKKDGSLVEHLVDRAKAADIQPLLVKGIIDYFSDAGFKVSADQIHEYLSLDGDAIPLPAWEPYPSEKGLEFIYQQYEIASYAAGMPSFTVSYDDIAPFLTPQGQAIKEAVAK